MPTQSLMQELTGLRAVLANAAQSAVDEWSQDELGFDMDLGFGGVCDFVSEAMAEVITSHIVDAEIVEGGQEGDDYSWLIVLKDGQAVGVDISPGVYEIGSGYSWKKINGAKVLPSNVDIWPIDGRDFVASRCAKSGKFEPVVPLKKRSDHVRMSEVRRSLLPKNVKNAFLDALTKRSEARNHFPVWKYDEFDVKGVDKFQKAADSLLSSIKKIFNILEFSGIGTKEVLEALKFMESSGQFVPYENVWFEADKWMWDCHRLITKMFEIVEDVGPVYKTAGNVFAVDVDDMRLQPGPAFHLQPDGTWVVESVPAGTVKAAKYSGKLAIEGYLCAVFEIGGDQWAQKIGSGVSVSSEVIRRIAARVANSSRKR